MEIINISGTDIQALDRQLLDSTGRIKLLPAAYYRAIPHALLKIWCVQRARYQLPTVELVQWLKAFIGDRTAIEIGSGNGDLYYHLGIPGTDNYSQQLPDVRLYYQMMGYVPTFPPDDVQPLDALAAIEHFKPDIVIGAWISQRAYEHEPPGEGNVYGPEEREIIQASTYVHIGNLDTHQTKRILKYPHQQIRIDGLVSKATRPDRNCLHVWQKGASDELS